MHAVAQEHAEQVAVGINPQHSPGESPVAERAGAKADAPIDRIARLPIPPGGSPDTAPRRRPRDRVPRGQRRHCLGPQQLPPLEASPRQQAAGEAGQIAGG